MKYDFSNPPSRRGTSCYKWDSFPGDYQMWVADMDFATAPEIIAAIKARVEHGIYGYAKIPEEWTASYQSFYRDEYQWEIPGEALVFALGVVPILSSSVRALTEAGDNVVILPPVYNIFYNSIVNNKRNVLEVPLVEREGQFYIDFGGIEAAFAQPKTKLCIFCNPGNPVARIWNAQELNELAALAKKYGVIILSDEIHGLVTRPGIPYQPFLTAKKENEEVGFAAISPTKAFNLAGIHTAALVCPNPAIRAKVERQLNTDEVAEPNVFSTVASIAALNQGREWLKQCKEVLFANRDLATAFINDQIPGLYAYGGDATYLLWVNCKDVEPNAEKLLAYLSSTQGLVFNDGAHYGKGGEGHFRINLACPTSRLKEALERLKRGIETYGKR
ncbi:MAG: PatB family C-S lyase [Bacilli bacterium]|nr:PatB family C-S lyase [Bacilli bacterium]